MLAWQRPAVHKCRCGLDLRTVPPEAAAADLVAINAVIYRATGLKGKPTFWPQSGGPTGPHLRIGFPVKVGRALNLQKRRDPGTTRQVVRSARSSP
jgi:hypothetical protein